jgi:phage baseplate assembly protein W
MPTIAIDSIINTSIVSSVSTRTTSYIGSATNASVVSPFGATIVVRFGSATNTSLLNAVTVTRHETYSLDSITNTSSLGDIRRLGVIGFDSIRNASSFGQFLASHNNAIDFSSIINSSSVGSIQAYLPTIVVDTFTPIVRPVKTISTQTTGLRKFKFRDIAIKGGSHPLTGDLLTVSDSSAVGQSIRNIILTNQTERFFDHIEFGVGIESYLFDLYDDDLGSRLHDHILSQVAYYEPRAIIIDVVMHPISHLNQLGIDITYKIKTTDYIDVVSITLERR